MIWQSVVSDRVGTVGVGRTTMDDVRRRQLARATSSLQAWLDRLEFVGLSRQVVTATITAEVVAWAKAHRFDTRQEVEAVAKKRKPYGRNIGLLDVACTHPSGQQLAIEVDFTNKIWSIEKLAAEADAGKLAIWVKWGGPASLSLIPEKIGVVELHADWV